MAEYTAVQRIEGYAEILLCTLVHLEPVYITTVIQQNHTKKGSRLRPLPLGGGSENPSKALPPHPPFGGA